MKQVVCSRQPFLFRLRKTAWSAAAPLVYLLLNLLLGTAFSKWQIVGPLHLSDAYLAILVLMVVIFGIPRYGVRLFFPPVLILNSVAVIYLVFSLASHQDSSLQIIVRQYALFGYFLLSHLFFLLHI